MIVVIGRPRLDVGGELDGPQGRLATAAAAAGGRVELVGSVGDDADGDTVAIELGRAGVGHAALLRDPAAATPSASAESPLPRLEAADIELALRYLADCHVLVLAEPLSPDATAVVVEAAGYHGAALIVIRHAETASPAGLPDSATVLESVEGDGGAFIELVARYAVQLDAGRPASEAWHDAVGETGWEPATG